MASTGFTARPRSASTRAEPDTVQPKDETELAQEDFAMDHDGLDPAEIERLAYGYWLERQGTGRGSELDDWLRAERELRINKRRGAAQSAGHRHSTL